jgi:ribosomal protein S1
MIEIGTVVEATVVRTAPFGVFLQSGGDTIFTPLNNLSWTPSADILSQFEVGKTIRVLVERFNYEKGEYAGNLKVLVPEQNPYRGFSILPAGKVLRGRVKMVHQNGVTVEMNEWCSGELPLTEIASKLVEGTEVSVQITSLELNDQRMTLKLFGPE